MTDDKLKAIIASLGLARDYEKDDLEHSKQFYDGYILALSDVWHKAFGGQFTVNQALEQAPHGLNKKKPSINERPF